MGNQSVDQGKRSNHASVLANGTPTAKAELVELLGLDLDLENTALNAPAVLVEDLGDASPTRLAGDVIGGDVEAHVCSNGSQGNSASSNRRLSARAVASNCASQGRGSVWPRA